MIRAPFNFVPLSDTVVFPEWASRISHDIPFSDGISGTISVKLTALTPIFVRNGHTRTDAEQKGSQYQSFSRTNDRYVIPGTTVKGAIRNVLEIMSFSKMRLDKDTLFSQRDWLNGSLYDVKDVKYNNSIRCGWLIIEDGKYKIRDCGKPRRIAQDRIDTYLECTIFRDNFSKGHQLNDKRIVDGELIDPKTVYYKYRLLESKGLIGKLQDQDLGFIKDKEYTTHRSQNRMKVPEEGEGHRDISGTIVLTGQPDEWAVPEKRNGNKEAGKFYEFIFPSNNGGTKYTLSEEEFNRYKAMYADSTDWKYLWEKKPYGDKIPVFFRKDEKDENKIKDWGLAYMYKLPYKRTPYDTLPDKHKKEDIDMSECLFGYARKDSSLKGRVQFSPFFGRKVDVADSQRNPVNFILGSPKASYYPIYMDQGQSNDTGRLANVAQYRTLNNGRIRGWKRYHRRNYTWGEYIPGNDDNKEMVSSILPLAADSTFEGKIRFHNLKPEELGALLSAITFHGNQNDCCHQIGMAKPYGYGKVKVEISGMEIQPMGMLSEDIPADPEFFMGLFEKYMTSEINELWTASLPVKELLIISKYDVPEDNRFKEQQCESCLHNGAKYDVPEDNRFKYMSLEVGGTNEFNNAKDPDQDGGPLYLQKISTILSPSFNTASMAKKVNSSIETFENRRNEHKAEIERKHEEIKRLELEQQEIQKRQESYLKILTKELYALVDALLKGLDIKVRNAEKLAAGLSFLDEKYDQGPNIGKYRVDKFKTARDKIDQYLRKTECSILRDDQYATLHETLLRLSKKPEKQESKLWKDESSSLWKYVKQITNEKFAKSVFDEINGSK